MKSSEFVIVGGGLVGSLMAINLAMEGHKVKLFEKRPDMRKLEIDGGRSINLALSHRGIQALERVGIMDKIKPFYLEG